MTDLKTYLVWDANIRWFHWINVLCVLGLIAVGVAILNDKALGVSTEGKILLKTVHVYDRLCVRGESAVASGLGLYRWTPCALAGDPAWRAMVT